MENESRFQAWVSKINDKLSEQVWFQQLKQKWEELDQQSRMYLKVAAAGASVLFVFIMMISSIWSVHSLKNELAEKSDLLNTIQAANEELRNLRASNPSAEPQGDGGESPNWLPYFQNAASTVGIEQGSLDVSSPKPGASTDMAKESLFDINLKHVNVKQVVKYAFNLENGAKPIKLRNLLIDTKPDLSGYLDATLAVSAFNLK
jgi:hypothetical protein